MILQTAASDYKSVIEQQAAAMISLMIENAAFRRAVQDLEIALAIAEVPQEPSKNGKA